MPKKSDTIDYGDEIMGWKVAEYEKHARTRGWYLMSGIIALLLLKLAYESANVFTRSSGKYY